MCLPVSSYKRYLKLGESLSLTVGILTVHYIKMPLIVNFSAIGRKLK